MLYDFGACPAKKPPLFKKVCMVTCLRTRQNGGEVLDGGFRRRDADGCGRDDRDSEKVLMIGERKPFCESVVAKGAE